MHKLTRVEAERVMAVLQETLEKLRQLHVIPPQHNIIVAKELKLDGKHKGAETLTDLWSAETARTSDVRPFTRAFLRILRTDAQVLDKLEAYAEQPSPALEDFIDALEDLKGITIRKLSTTVEDENIQKTFVEDVTAKMKKSEEERQMLTQKLNSIRKSKEESISNLDTTIRTLRGELAYLKQTTEQQASSLAKETEQKNTAAKVEYEDTTAKLREQVAKLQEQIATMEEENKNMEAGYRKKKMMAQRELQSWVGKYDKDITVHFEKLEELRSQYDKEKEELNELEEYFRKWDAERARIAEEEHLIAEERARQQAAQKVLEDAAIMIQSAYRGYKQREEFERMKKKKKGKKKKRK